jgi:membrane fusion protein (multidrug efflux system)
MLKTSKRIFITTFLLGLISFSCKEKKTKTQTTGAGGPGQQQTLSVDAIIAKTKTLSANIEVPGSLLANESTEIRPEVSGRLVQLNVREGAFVGQGALLAKLYDGDLQAQKKKLQVQLQIAEQTERRQGELLKIQGISQQEYDLSLLQVNNLKADIDIVGEAIRKTEIRAPFSGKLGLKNISPGAYITPTTIITTIGQVNQLKIQFNVPEKYGSQLKPGQVVTFVVDGSLKNFTASILAAEIQIEETTRSLAVRALVKNSDNALIPGAFAKVRIVLGKNDDAIMIPNFVVTPQGRKKLVYLYRDGKSVSTEITTGVRDSSYIQVLDGIKLGDTVITTGLLFLRPNADVKLNKVSGDL